MFSQEIKIINRSHRNKNDHNYKVIHKYEYHRTQFVINYLFLSIKFLSLIDYDCETPSLFEKLVSIEIGLSYLNLKYILCKIDITKD